MAQDTESTSFTRWHALAGGCLFNIAIGAYYAWSVFVKPLQTEFPEWTRMQTTSVASVNMVMLAVLYNVAGTLIGRFGARNIALFGGLCFSSGMFLASFALATTMALLLTLVMRWNLGEGFERYTSAAELARLDWLVSNIEAE